MATVTTDSVVREVLLTDTDKTIVDSIPREVLLSDTAILSVDSVIAEALVINPSALQVANVFAEVLRSTTIWVPTGGGAAGMRNRTYRIR